MRLEGKVAIVTGAARGTGEATARRFAEEGAQVVLGDILDDPGAAVAEDMGPAALYQHLDVTQESDWARVLESTLERFGGVDVLVNNAAILEVRSISETSVATFRKLMEVNQLGPFLGTQSVIEPMKARGGGSIINVSSMAGKTSWPNSAEYSATKSGVIGLTRSVAMELGPHGITANAVCPGNTLTDMVRSVAGEVGETVGMSGDNWLAMRADDTALKRLAQPWEVAGVIAFRASRDAAYIPGQSIGVDGGLILS